jgi:hypothetical protein
MNMAGDERDESATRWFGVLSDEGCGVAAAGNSTLNNVSVAGERPRVSGWANMAESRPLSRRG